MWRKIRQNQKEELFARNKLLRACFLVLIVCIAHLGKAEHHFSFNKKLVSAQAANLELRLGVARGLLQEELLNDPTNSAVHYLLHLNAFLKAFISEEQSDYDAYRQVQNNALLHYESLHDSIALKKLAQSDAYFYGATLKAKLEEFYSAAIDVKRAYSLINENFKLFPEFLPNNKIRGIIKIYLSRVPDNYMWVIRVLGMSGNLQEGLSLLQSLAQTKQDTGIMKYFAKEAAYLYSFSLIHVAKLPDKAWSETLKCTKDYTTNLLSTYFRSTIAAKLNKNETAISILEHRPTSSEYEKVYFLDYIMGVALLSKLDVTSILHLHQFYTHSKGKNYQKSVLQKMSWYYIIFHNEQKASYYKQQILTVGKDINEEDKQAMRYATKDVPHVQLLKVRLLYDGGYIEQAKEIISEIEVKNLENNELKAEYCYRRGRIAEKLGFWNNALKLYEACTLYGAGSDEYYATYASIYLGDYYLEQDQKTAAKKFYESALSFKNNKEHVSAARQRALAGLRQLR